jgi:hypothetical protein
MCSGHNNIEILILRSDLDLVFSCVELSRFASETPEQREWRRLNPPAFHPSQLTASANANATASDVRRIQPLSEPKAAAADTAVDVPPQPLQTVWCAYCKQHVHISSKHCLACAKCVYQFDHHCKVRFALFCSVLFCAVLCCFCWVQLID